MSSLEHINQVKSEIRVDENGRGFATIRATARLAGVSEVALRKAIKGANLDTSKTAETFDVEDSEGANLNAPKLTQKLLDSGISAGDILAWPANGIPDTAITLIVEYYTFDAGRYCTDTAKAFYRSIASVGIRSLFRQATGWIQQTPPAPQPEQKALPWTPPPLYPNMTEATFKALPAADQDYFAETPAERTERIRRESREIRTRYYY